VRSVPSCQPGIDRIFRRKIVGRRASTATTRIGLYISRWIFQVSLTTAEALQQAVAALIASPSDQTLQAARNAWIAARVPYQQTEAFRFGNAIVDDWEGRVNSWPLDEGLIDYTAADYGNEENTLAALNIIATPEFTLSGTRIDASTITPALIAETLHEADRIEVHVAFGY
jgi:putative iron-regulated protein